MISKVIKLALIAILGMAYSLLAKDDNISKFFEKYSNVEGVTFVSFNPSPQLMESFGEQMDNKENAEMLKNINSIKILTSKKKNIRENQEKANPQNLENIYQDALKTFPLDEFKEFLKVREGKKDVKVLYKVSTEKSKATEFLIISKEDGELSIVFVEGMIDMKDLSKLSKMMKK